MTKSQVKELISKHLDNEKIVDICIYYNEYTKVYQATVITVTKYHTVNQYIIDESGFCQFGTMMCDDTVKLPNKERN